MAKLAVVVEGIAAEGKQQLSAWALPQDCRQLAARRLQHRAQPAAEVQRVAEEKGWHWDWAKGSASSLLVPLDACGAAWASLEAVGSATVSETRSVLCLLRRGQRLHPRLVRDRACYREASRPRCTTPLAGHCQLHLETVIFGGRLLFFYSCSWFCYAPCLCFGFGFACFGFGSCGSAFFQANDFCASLQESGLRDVVDCGCPCRPPWASQCKKASGSFVP